MVICSSPFLHLIKFPLSIRSIELLDLSDDMHSCLLELVKPTVAVRRILRLVSGLTEFDSLGESA